MENAKTIVLGSELFLARRTLKRGLWQVDFTFGRTGRKLTPRRIAHHTPSRRPSGHAYEVTTRQMAYNFSSRASTENVVLALKSHDGTTRITHCPAIGEMAVDSNPAPIPVAPELACAADTTGPAIVTGLHDRGHTTPGGFLWSTHRATAQ